MPIILFVSLTGAKKSVKAMLFKTNTRLRNIRDIRENSNLAERQTVTESTRFFKKISFLKSQTCEMKAK